MVYNQVRAKSPPKTEDEIAAEVERRHRELQQKGIDSNYQEILANLKERDHKDSSREHSPLTKADDAEFIDTTEMTLDEQIELILKQVSGDTLIKSQT